MSNLLERAIVDAKALREAALRNAEQLVIEKYSKEIKESMSDLLEEDPLEDFGATDPMADPMADLSMEPELGTEDQPTTEEDAVQPALNPEDIIAKVPSAFDTDEDETIQIRLDSLEAEIEDEEAMGPFASGEEFDDKDIGIDIQDDDAVADFDIDTTPDMDTTPDADIGVDISPEMIAEILSEMEIILNENIKIKERLKQYNEYISNIDQSHRPDNKCTIQ